MDTINFYELKFTSVGRRDREKGEERGRGGKINRRGGSEREGRGEEGEGMKGEERRESVCVRGRERQKEREHSQGITFSIQSPTT